MNFKMRFATVAAVLVLTVMGSASEMWAQQVRLTACKNRVINGIEAQLRGDYRERTSPVRLNADLENINIPVGTPVAFCLLQNGVKTLIGVGKVAMIGGVPVATVDLAATDGDFVPNVNAGDVLQARQRNVAPFNPNPGCGAAMLISAAFQ
ncbi:MAG: hypothetical protein LAO24_13345 [Acidobacteriia bacterium]|nr:hypothetical protein [Terriglobia bacterium]